MTSYAIRRTLLMIPTLLIVTFILFFSIRLIPGDIIDQMLAEQVSGGRGSEAMSRAKLEAALGLDVPIHIQYFRWLGDALRGDLGLSLWKQTSVTELVLQSLPITLELGFMGILIGLIIALPIGIYSGIRQDTAGDYIGRSIAIASIALPGFWLGTMVVVFPSIWWNWSPSIMYIPFTEDPLGNLGMFIIPAFILGMNTAGVTMRMMRSMVLEVLRQDYIRTAWAKGLRERTVIFRHVLKNALIPVVTIIGLYMPVVIGGTVILEQIFVLPGMGRLLVNAAFNRDYTIISGVVLFTATFVVIMNLLVDLTYGFLDPRVKYA